MPYQPDEIEQAVLDVLKREGRANPLRIREETDIRKQYVNNALRQLDKAELVRKVTTGLYEYTGSDAPGTVDKPALNRALDDVENAAERGDGDALRKALQRAREILNES